MNDAALDKGPLQASLKATVYRALSMAPVVSHLTDEERALLLGELSRLTALYDCDWPTSILTKNSLWLGDFAAYKYKMDDSEDSIEKDFEECLTSIALLCDRALRTDFFQQLEKFDWTQFVIDSNSLNSIS